MKTKHLPIIVFVFISLITAVTLFAQTKEPDADAIIAEIMRFADSTNTGNSRNSNNFQSTANTPAQSDKASGTTGAVFTENAHLLATFALQNVDGYGGCVADWGDYDNDGDLDLMVIPGAPAFTRTTACGRSSTATRTACWWRTPASRSPTKGSSAARPGATTTMTATWT